MSPILTRLSGPNAFLQGGSLVFEANPAGNILSEVWLPGGAGILLRSIPKEHQRVVFSFTELSQTGSVSGKTAFELTCAQCHGKDGKGDANADQFFHMPIPRLASKDVQSKSDAEIKQIITEGTQVMPPVEVEESGFRHRLPPQDVDVVLGYLRTLKE